MPVPLRVGQELRAEADQPARGNAELEPHAAAAVVHHLRHHAACASPTCAMTTPWKSSGTSMTSSSTGSTLLAVDLLGDDLRPRHLQLEALAPHHLDQDRQLQLAAADDLHLLGRVGRLDADRDVAEQLLVEPLAAACAT